MRLSFRGDRGNRIDASQFVVENAVNARGSIAITDVPPPMIRTRHHFPSHESIVRRRGVATLDYVLLLGVVLPILAIVIPQGRRMMQLVFEMTCALISWPFM